MALSILKEWPISQHIKASLWRAIYGCAFPEITEAKPADDISGFSLCFNEQMKFWEIDVQGNKKTENYKGEKYTAAHLMR